MSFGDDENIEYFRQYLNGTIGYDYDYICKVIDLYGRKSIYSQGFVNDNFLLKDDIDDVLQEIQIFFRKNLVKYVKNSSKYSSAQRNAYFNIVVKRQVYDFGRKNHKKYQQKILYYDSEEENLQIADSASVENDVIANSYYTQEEIVYKIIQSVCEVNTSSEKILAYLYTRIIYTLNTNNNKKSGSPQKVSEVLTGITYRQIYDELKIHMDCLLDKKLPPDIFSKLKDSIDEQNLWNHTFSLDVKKITDSNYLIEKKIVKLYDEEKGKSI